jgi:hypothetical protein
MRDKLILLPLQRILFKIFYFLLNSFVNYSNILLYDEIKKLVTAK